MERIVTSLWICVRQIVLFYAVFIIVIVVNMKSFCFVYCVLFGIQVYHSISARFATPNKKNNNNKKNTYILCYRNWDI